VRSPSLCPVAPERRHDVTGEDGIPRPKIPAPGRPTVTAQHPELRTAAATTVLASGYPLLYVRGNRHLVVVNPTGTARTADIPSLAARTARPLEASGTAVAGGRVQTGAFGYGVFALEPPAGQPAAVTLPADAASHE
jgi:hypothetical protein